MLKYGNNYGEDIKGLVLNTILMEEATKKLNGDTSGCSFTKLVSSLRECGHTVYHVPTLICRNIDGWDAVEFITLHINAGVIANISRRFKNGNDFVALLRYDYNLIIEKTSTYDVGYAETILYISDSRRKALAKFKSILSDRGINPPKRTTSFKFENGNSLTVYSTDEQSYFRIRKSAKIVDNLYDTIYQG